MGGSLKKHKVKSALAELGSAASGLEVALREFLGRFCLVFRAFLTLEFLVILYGNHKKRQFFIQRELGEKHRLLPQTAPRVYYISLSHKCP